MITIYAEKPDMANKIAAALDGIHLDSGHTVSFSELDKWDRAIKAQRTRDGYFLIRRDNQDIAVTWGFGHMCELKQAKDYNPEFRNWNKLPLPYIPDSYELKLTGPEKQYDTIRKLFNSSDYIISATDDDREGDLIFYYLYSYMQCRVPFKRALFNKQSQDEFIKAFNNHNLIDGTARQNVIDAGRARSAGDFVVGAGLTAALTLKYPGNDVLSVGRVQTAVLNIIVERELEITHFKPQDFWVLGGRFTTSTGECYIALHENKRFTSKDEAQRLFDRLQSGSRQGIVTAVDIKKYGKKKPFLYSLASLQMDANKQYGYSLERTLELAQSLYEKGYTTYPRTDSVHLPNDMVNEMTHVLSMLFTVPMYNKLSVNTKVNGKDRHYFDSSKVESHYAIVPTAKYPSDLSQDEGKVYDLIARSAICMVYNDAVMSRTQIKTDVDGEIFMVSGTSIVEPGFLSVTGLPRESVIPCVKKGEGVSAEFAIETRQTEPPKRYTDATILKAMINCGKNIEDEELKKLMANGPGGKPRGLGRPSSQASIVGKLEQRGYTTKRGKTIIPTSKGMLLIRCFPVEDLKSPVMTAQWERRLDDIESGLDNYASFMSDLENHVRDWTQQVINAKEEKELIKSSGNESKYLCPVCGKALREFEWGYSCVGHQNGTCNFSVGKVIYDKRLSSSEINSLLTNGRTGIVDGFVNKSGKKYPAILYIDKESQKWKLCFDLGLMCPICGKPLYSADWGFGCTGYKDKSCRFSIGTVAGKKLTTAQIVKIINGEAVLIKGMKRKDGSKFQGQVSLAKTADGLRINIVGC